MFVLCPHCHNHYDDTCQAKKCNGPGSNLNHIPDGRPKPVSTHIAATREARIGAALGGNA